MKNTLKIVSLSFLIFGYGVAIGSYQIFPYQLMKNIKNYVTGNPSGYHTKKQGIAPTQTVTILEPDKVLNSRAFASIIIQKNKYHIFYAGRSRESGRYSLYTRSSFDLKGLSNAKEMLLLAPESVDAVMVWMPYIVKSGDQYTIFFTVRKGDISYYGDFNEFVMRLTSNDLKNFEVDSEVMVSAKLDWEGSEIENWGVIKIDDIFYMSLESRGKSQKQEDRSIGYASSNDLKNWSRVGSQPSITGGVCCSSFFVFDGYIYSISAAGNRFALHRARDFLDLTDKKLIGYFYPHGGTYEGSVDTPEVLGLNNQKSILNDDEFTLMFSSLRKGEWVTEYIRYANTASFLSNVYE